MGKKGNYTVILLSFPSVIVAIVVVILMYWYLATEISIDLIVNRVVFTVGGSGLVQLINPVTVDSVTIDHFDHIELRPVKLEVADPVQYQYQEDRYPNSAWTPISVKDHMVIITGMSQMTQYAATIEGIQPGKLDRIWIEPGSKVTLHLRGKGLTNLTMAIEEQKSSVILRPPEPFHIITDYCHLAGIRQLPYQADSLTWRGWLLENDPYIEVTSQNTPPSLFLNLTISSEQQAKQLSFKNKVPVTAVNFSKQDSMGDRKSSLMKPATVVYPGYPTIDKKNIKGIDFLVIEELQDFSIEKISLDSENNGIRLQLTGKAGFARAGSTDLRLTCFEALWYNWKLTILFGIIVWVFPTSAGFYKFFVDRKKKKL